MITNEHLTYINRLSGIPVLRQYIEEHCFFHPPFRTPGGNFFRISDFTFGLGGPHVSVPNFSFLPQLEIGYLFWTNLRTFTFSSKEVLNIPKFKIPLLAVSQTRTWFYLGSLALFLLFCCFWIDLIYTKRTSCIR
jgi:hypothetical protein